MEDKIGFLIFGYRHGFDVFAYSKLYESVISNIDRDSLLNYLKLEMSYLRPEPDYAILSCVRAKYKNRIVYFFIKYNFIKDYSNRNAYYATALILDNIYLESEQIYRLLDFCEEKIKPFIGQDDKIKEFKSEEIKFNINQLSLSYSDVYSFSFSEQKEIFLTNLSEGDLDNFFGIVYIQEYIDCFIFYTSVEGKVLLNNNDKISLVDGGNLNIESKLSRYRIKKNLKSNNDYNIDNFQEPPSESEVINLSEHFNKLLEEFEMIKNSSSDKLQEFSLKLIKFKKDLDSISQQEEGRKDKSNFLKRWNEKISKMYRGQITKIIVILILLFSFIGMSLFFYHFVIKEM